MGRFDPGRLTRAARAAAASLKAEYEAGKRGDDSPVTPLWRSPKEQLDAVLGLLRSAATDSSADAGDTETPDTEADEVAAALHGVDWDAARAAMSEKTAEAARTVRSMADHVDWAKVQPVAAQVSSALIAAVASGQLGLGGRLGPTVARAIVDQGGFGQRVGAAVQRRQAAAPAAAPVPDFRGAIEATSRET